MYTRVAISATSLSSRFIEWKNCKAFSDPSENRSACSLNSWHYMYLKIPLFICIRKFSILAVISEFQSSTKVAKKKIHSIDRLQFCFNLKFCVDLTKYWLINILIICNCDIVELFFVTLWDTVIVTIRKIYSFTLNGRGHF